MASITRKNQYNGLLSLQQIVDGMNAARLNGQRLARDAALLLDNERYATAASIAILSIEESGKISVLRLLSCASTLAEAKAIWREYRDHTAKNRLWPILDLVRKGARKLDDFAALFEADAKHSAHIDAIKQLGFYTDCFGNATWARPEEVIGKDLAKVLVCTADLLVRGDAVSTDDVDLWIQHLGPHINGSKVDALEALERWYQELQHLGMKPAGANLMTDFIRYGIGDSGDEGEGPTSPPPQTSSPSPAPSPHPHA